MDQQTVGRRIAYWRERRGLNQEDFGALMGGRSCRWVQSIEAGARQADPRLSVLESAARVLEVPLTALLSSPSQPTGVAAELAPIRAALQRHDVITGANDPGSAEPEPLPVATLRRTLTYGWTAFQSGHFGSLGRVVPELLVDATRAAAHHRGDDHLSALATLSMALQLAEATAIKYGDSQLAVIAADRAVAAAERSQDPVIMASAARHLCDAMTSDGQTGAAAQFALAAAGRLSGDLLTRGADGLSVLGMLYLKAALAQAATAATDDPAAAHAARAVPDLLSEADVHAHQLGADDNRLWTAFGLTNVSLYRVAAHLQLSAGADAVAAALAIPDPARAALPRERRAHHLSDLAHGYALAGRRQEAVATLLHAEREASEEVLGRPRTRQLIADLRLLGAGSSSGRLQELAERCGLPG